MSFFGVRKEFSEVNKPKSPLVQADLVTLKKSSGLLFCLSKALGDRRKE